MNRSFALDTAALALLAAIALIMLVLIGHVRAEPLPQPKVGACPSGYTESVGALHAHAPGRARRLSQGLGSVSVRLDAIRRILSRDGASAYNS